MNYWNYLKDEYIQSIFVYCLLLIIWFIICMLYPTENIINATPKLIGISIFGILARSFLRYMTKDKYR